MILILNLGEEIRMELVWTILSNDNIWQLHFKARWWTWKNPTIQWSGFSKINAWSTTRIPQVYFTFHTLTGKTLSVFTFILNFESFPDLNSEFVIRSTNAQNLKNCWVYNISEMEFNPFHNIGTKDQRHSCSIFQRYNSKMNSTKKDLPFSQKASFSRGEWIRTIDPLVPNQVR